MFHSNIVYFLLLAHLIRATPVHINLYYTNENHFISPHTCLYMRFSTFLDKSDETARFCLSEFVSSHQIQKQPSYTKFTFDQLAKQNITSEQLYFWSAPIDVIERYQFYLNQLSNKTGDLSSANDEYYNCTLPNFGPRCQYTLAHNILDYSSLNHYILSYYQNFVNDPFNLTCYTHLKCNRGLPSPCLDWREICDGKIDCFDGGFDEEHCWQLEVNECQQNEFQCQNGQCIPKSFYRDDFEEPDCIDLSDERSSLMKVRGKICFFIDGPSFKCEDTSTTSYEELNSHAMERTKLLMKTIYSNKDPFLSDNCSLAFQCLLNILYSESCCQKDECLEVIENDCPEAIYFPNIPILFTNIYFVYKRDEFADSFNFSAPPLYICSNESNYHLYFKNHSNTNINNMTCIDSRLLYHPSYFSDYSTVQLHIHIINTMRAYLRQYHVSFIYNSTISNQSNIYQCENSVKYISMHRLMDFKKDCPYDDDENATITSTISYLHKIYFNCQNGRYIPQFFVADDNCDCGYIELVWCPDEDFKITFLKANLVFQHLCDGFVDLAPVLIDGRNESDETECQQWQCNNIYTYCNMELNCPNGADEVYCNQSDPLLYLSDCLSSWHQCVSPSTKKLYCLSVEQYGDGIIDCLGATDEPDLCGERLQMISIIDIRRRALYCRNFSSSVCIYSDRFCDGHNNCPNRGDEEFCTKITIDPNLNHSEEHHDEISNAEKFLFEFHAPNRRWNVINFQFDGLIRNTETMNYPLISSTSIINTPILAPTRLRYCHRGLDIDVLLDHSNNLATYACLCPSSYYGDRCQFQNQRISLTIKFNALASSWRKPFAIIISLIDDSEQRLIHSYEQINYLSAKNCKSKFSRYLIYSTQPKDPVKTYSIHIDFYDKTSLEYRASALFPVKFWFLPVYRVSLVVNIPRIQKNRIESCSIDRCDHGKCMIYANQPENITFCQCHSGWTGRYCHIRFSCDCSAESLCVGISADNRSICVCPVDKFGRRCLLTDTICQKQSNSTCQNGGQCVSNHRGMTFYQDFLCICQKNFTGDRCEIAYNQLTITFDKLILLSQSIFFHFIEIVLWEKENNFTLRTTTYRSIPFRQDSITVYWSEPFHLVFTELSNKTYYLTLIQKEYNRSARIQRTVTPFDRCPNITELFNQTFLQWHILRRIKYYHLPCQNYSLNLSCFHDESHLCLCYDFQQQRLANCFTFDHQMKFDCFGQSECENDGQCLQNKVDCPTKSWCVCQPCYYGQLCQFSTSGFHLSLDGILGYHILPNINLVKQSFIVKMSFALTIIFLVIGFINGILSLATFKNKEVRELGCGSYLLFSSMITLLTMILFGLKYFILLLTQMSIISNRVFIQMQCQSLDYLLRVCLSLDQWLSACVAVERTIMIIQGANFNKRRSVKAVKFVVIILLIVIIGSYVHDPIHRRIVEEENDLDDTKRTWCIISYSSRLQVYNYAINTVHIIGPFFINLISVIILMKMKAQQELTIHTNRTYKELLFEQLRELKHLLIAPIVLVLLVLPRLITTFLSKCMQSSSDAWLFLVGYFISFIPSMLTFIIFVLPSTFYKQEFKNTVRQYGRSIRRCLHNNLD